MPLKLAAAAVAMLVAAPATADSSRNYSVGVIGGYAAEADSIWQGNVSKFRYGVGARAGVSFPKLYVGLALVHHFGTVQTARGVGSTFDTNYHTTLAGAEIGYDAAFGRFFTMRPYVGAGLLWETSRTNVQGIELNDDNRRFHLTPGLIVGANIGHFVVGVDLRVVMSPLNAPVKYAPGAFATLGFRF